MTKHAGRDARVLSKASTTIRCDRCSEWVHSDEAFLVADEIMRQGINTQYSLRQAISRYHMCGHMWLKF